MHDAQHRSVMAFARQPFQDDHQERGWTVDGRRRRPVDSLLHCLSSILPNPGVLARTGAERRREREVRVSERAVSAGWLRGRMSEGSVEARLFRNARTPPPCMLTSLPCHSYQSIRNVVPLSHQPPIRPHQHPSTVDLSSSFHRLFPQNLLGANWALKSFLGHEQGT